MKTIFGPARSKRRMWHVITAVVLLLSTTAESASACGWTCFWEYGLVEVEDGEVFFYSGCVEIPHGDHTDIICYYDQFLN